MKYPAPYRSRENRGVAARRAAYTSSELLAILALGVVIAAILFPSFTCGRNSPKSLQSSCLSNMKQMGMAFRQYLTDYDGVYPAGDGDRKTVPGRPPERGAAAPPGREWFTVVAPYLPTRSAASPENASVFRCPSDPSRAPGTPEKWYRFGREEKVYASSYALNAWSAYDLKQSDIASPKTWILMAERNNRKRDPEDGWLFYFWTWQARGKWVWPPAAAPIPIERASDDLALTRHSEGANWLYGDGHAKWTRFSDLWKGGSENPFWPGHLPSPAPTPAPAP